MKPTRTIVGVMTGTSMDAVDAALVRIRGAGLSLQTELLDTRTASLQPVRADLRTISAGEPMPLRQALDTERRFSELVAEMLRAWLQPADLDLIAFHGQTVFHRPPLTCQLGNPWTIARALNVSVVSDFRRGDIAAGGEGAPLTPIADLVLFGSPEEKRTIVNLGGFCNVTQLPRADRNQQALNAVRGFDLCPCNHWLDRLSERYFQAAYDEGGRMASQGRVDRALCDELAHAWSTPLEAVRSLGTHDETLPHSERLAGKDLLATACEAIARLIARSCADADAIYCAGGSVRNAHLMSRLREVSPVPVRTTAEFGIAPEWREAVAMAVLGALCMDGVPIGLPSVTGAKHSVISGSWCFPSGIHRLGHD